MRGVSQSMYTVLWPGLCKEYIFSRMNGLMDVTNKKCKISENMDVSLILCRCLLTSMIVLEHRCFDEKC